MLPRSFSSRVRLEHWEQRQLWRRLGVIWLSARFFPVNCLRRAVQQLHDSTVRVSGRTREGLIGLSACAVRVTIERSSIQDERSALALEMNSVSVYFSRQLCGQLLYWER